MIPNLPNLEEGRIYRRDEVSEYIGEQTGSCDYNVFKSGFPIDIETRKDDHKRYRGDKEILLQYTVLPMSTLVQQIRKNEKTYSQDSNETRRIEHLDRIEKIQELLIKGDPVFPVFIQMDDPQHDIREGTHRSIALLRLNSPVVPAFLAGYPDWFEADRDSC